MWKNCFAVWIWWDPCPRLWVGCVFSGGCEQWAGELGHSWAGVAGLSWRVGCVCPAGGGHRRVCMAEGHIAGCLALLWAPSESFLGRSTATAVTLRGVSWPNPHLASPWLSLFVTRCITAWWGRVDGRASSAAALLPPCSQGRAGAGMLSVPGSCTPCLPGSVLPVVGALGAMPVGEDYELLFCGRWGCSALRSEVEMAAVGWQLSHSTLQQHLKFKPLGKRNYFLSSLLPFRVKVHVLYHLKPEDVRLLLRSACHINKTDTLHLENQQKNLEEAAREWGTVWPSKEGPVKTCVSASTNIICKQSAWNCATSDSEAGTSGLQTAGRGAEE